jgi:hypothetical protein
MKDLGIVLGKLYWLAVAAAPFFPWYMLDALHTRLACAYGTPCFNYGVPYYAEGAVAGLLTGVLLWPMCAWQLGGGFLWRRLVKARSGT